ncbi:MAG: zinc-dependent alcohol dehydrogenase family protein [Candidatus Aminicenantia bacterium]
MKAMILTNIQPIEKEPLILKEILTPLPAKDEIRIKIYACGICHTDLHIIEGDLPLPKLPLIPGHQIVGVVEKVGENVSKFREGDRVGVPWLSSTCQRCEFCQRGKENLCDEARFTGYHTDGGYAQYMVISEDFAYHIPDDVSDFEIAPLLCGGVIGYRALRLTEIKPGDRLGLYGFGASAHIVIQIARHRGCKVFVFTRSEAHRALARNLGAVWTGKAEDELPEKMHGSIIFAPAGHLVPEALRVLQKGGTLALAGIYMTPIPEIEYSSLLYHERTVRSVANSTRQDVRDLLKLAGEIPLRTQVQVFPLEEANKALQLLKRSRIQASAGVLEIPQE